MSKKLYLGLILRPGEKPIRFWRYVDPYVDPTDLEEIRREEIQRWRKWEGRDDIDVRYYLIGEVEGVVHPDMEKYREFTVEQLEEHEKKQPKFEQLELELFPFNE